MIFSDVIEIEMVVVLLVICIRNDICFNTRTVNCEEIENIFDILLPKSKLIDTGIFYRPSNQVNLMELIIKGFSHLNLKDNEIYLLHSLNISLLWKGNYILNGKGMSACQAPVHTLINKYQEFCPNIFFKATNNLIYICFCMCVCVYHNGFSWMNKAINVMPEFRSGIVCWENNSVSSTFVTTSQTISRDLQAGNCTIKSVN